MKFFAKLFGYIGGAAIAAGQSGVFGAKCSPIIGAAGAISTAVAVHAASNSGPTD